VSKLIHLILSQNPQDDVVSYTAEDFDCPVPDISFGIARSWSTLLPDTKIGRRSTVSCPIISSIIFV
jgi:hypothetical protein